MPTVLGAAYSPLWRGKYPHMLTEDRPLWERYLDQHTDRFIQVFYDVRIGGITPATWQGTQTEREMYYQVTAKRIDALAELENEVWIIEVAAKPGLRVTGQIMSYFFLWNQDPKINKTPVPVVIAPFLDADLKASLEAYGVRIRILA